MIDVVFRPPVVLTHGEALRLRAVAHAAFGDDAHDEGLALASDGKWYVYVCVGYVHMRSRVIPRAERCHQKEDVLRMAEEHFLGQV